MNSHIAITAADPKSGKHRPLVIPEDFSIDIDDQNPLFNDNEMFSYPVQINEAEVAGACGVTVAQLRVLLYKLSLEHIIKYVPSDHSSIIFLHHNRLRPGNVNLEAAAYESLRESYHERSEAMLSYASETDECRSQYLLRYFGQEESEPCSTCDVCRSGSSRPSSAVTTRAAGLPDYEAATEQWLRDNIAAAGGVYTLDGLKVAFESAQLSLSPSWPRILRRLIDDGELPMPQSSMTSPS